MRKRVIPVSFFESYLKDRTQCCSVNGHISSLEMIQCVLPQGIILGPLCLDVVDITMFADDTNLMKAIFVI